MLGPTLLATPTPHGHTAHCGSLLEGVPTAMALGAQDGAAGQVVGRGGRGCLGLGRLHSWPGPPESIRSSLSAEPPSVGWSWALVCPEYRGGRPVTHWLSAWLCDRLPPGAPAPPRADGGDPCISNP